MIKISAWAVEICWVAKIEATSRILSHLLFAKDWFRNRHSSEEATQGPLGSRTFLNLSDSFRGKIISLFFFLKSSNNVANWGVKVHSIQACVELKLKLRMTTFLWRVKLTRRE